MLGQFGPLQHIHYQYLQSKAKLAVSIIQYVIIFQWMQWSAISVQKELSNSTELSS